MPTPKFSGMPTINAQDASLEQLRAYVMQLQDQLIKMQRDLTYLLGNLDYENMFAVGGWRVQPDRMQSKDGDVGMSTEDTSGDDIRFWAGDVITGTPAFYVTKSGKLYAMDGTFVGTITGSEINGSTITGGTIQTTASSYPRIELSSTGNLLRAMAAVNNFISVLPDVAGSPAIRFINGSFDALLSSPANTLLLETISTSDIQISPKGNLFLSAGSLFKVRFDSWNSIHSTLEGWTLKQELDYLQDQIDDLEDRVSDLE